jgi:cytoskeletal protein CcmA (bactofilin family)
MADNLSNAGNRPNPWDTPSLGPVTEHATIGSSIVIKGEVSGQEALFIDGTVQGAIHFPGHRVTLGRGSRIEANITAREVVVMGSVKGNIHCGDLLDVRSESNIQGEIMARRVCIDDGAILKGSVEIERPDKNRQPTDKEKENGTAAKAEGSVPAAPPPPAEEAKPEPSKAQVLAEAVARRVAGSSVLLKPVR